MAKTDLASYLCSPSSKFEVLSQVRDLFLDLNFTDGVCHGTETLNLLLALCSHFTRSMHASYFSNSIQNVAKSCTIYSCMYTMLHLCCRHKCTSTTLEHEWNKHYDIVGKLELTIPEIPVLLAPSIPTEHTCNHL